MRIRSTAVFTALRLLAFLVPFGIMMLFPVLREYYWLSAIFAALIGLSLSVLFLRRPLADMATDMEERRSARRRRTGEEQDAAAEDAAAGDAAGEA
ncbi:DUF4229 domain-containing protein [Microbacterium telephonicum]|uniref:Uncharacterized protein DUF4229 n=1 Tax=Microbacterium telephonicum TaxID=1714841 RepID=A0A498CM54_9MICO|nr:DUF4229 domain-containing protein [Microbacterium telephonicum]RLK52838.1 uncharacterized protein DUF4229 [Microbacterium telephonicum]